MSELARKIEMDQGLLSKIERGMRPPPQLVPHVQRIGAALGMKNESSEFKKLVEAAYKERFPREKWPAVLSLQIGESGAPELLRTPVRRPGLGDYTPPKSREIIRPDSPVGRELGLRSDGTLPPPPDFSRLFANVPQWTVRDEAHSFLCQLEVTDVEREGEHFLFHARHPLSDRRFKVTVSPMDQNDEDKQHGAAIE